MSKAIAINPHHFSKVATICGATPPPQKKNRSCVLSPQFSIHLKLCSDNDYKAGIVLHHRGTNLSEQHIADLMFCYGTQAMRSSRFC